MIVVAGGASNGKSVFAERLAARSSWPVTYLATMRNDNAESALRVSRHRARRRDLGFSTLERPIDVGFRTHERPPLTGTVLLECLPTLLDNEAYGQGREAAAAASRVAADVKRLNGAVDRLIVVTNRLSVQGAVDEATEAYVHALTALNASLCAEADGVVEVVAGCPLWLKGAPQGDGVWADEAVLAPGQSLSGPRPWLIVAPDDVTLNGSEVVDVAARWWADGAIDADELSWVTAHMTDDAVFRLAPWGDGLMPLDVQARRRREALGRLAVALASVAGQVFVWRAVPLWPGDLSVGRWTRGKMAPSASGDAQAKR